MQSALMREESGLLNFGNLLDWFPMYPDNHSRCSIETPSTPRGSGKMIKNKNWRRCTDDYQAKQLSKTAVSKH